MENSKMKETIKHMSEKMMMMEKSMIQIDHEKK